MLRSSITVVTFSLFVQLIGFAKLLLIARYFGAGAVLDGYYLALVIPGLLLGFVGGGLQTSFMPVYGKLLSQGDLERARSFRSDMFWALLILLLLVSLSLFAARPAIIPLIVPSASVEVEQFALYSFQWLVFTLLLNSLADYLALVLNAHQDFLTAAAAPLANILVATSILYLWPEWGLNTLIWGLLLGLLSQVSILLIVLYRKKITFGMSRLSISVDMRRAGQLVAPVLIGIALANANISIDQAMAAMAGTGAVSSLGYASRFHNVMVQAGVMGVSVVLLPALIRAVAESGELEALRILKKVAKWLLLFAIIAFLFIWLAGQDLLRLLLVRGSFDESALRQVYGVWFWYGLGLFPMGMGVFFAKYFLAIEQPIVIARLAVVSFLSNIALNYLLVSSYGVSGIAMATTLTYLLVTSLFLINTRRRGKLYAR